MSILSIKIDFQSLFKKGIKSAKDDFGIYLITGYQGSGKTYFSIYTMERLYKGKTIYTNIKSYKSVRNKVIYFNRVEDIYSNLDDNCVFLIDELSKKYTKNCGLNFVTLNSDYGLEEDFLQNAFGGRTET